MKHIKQYELFEGSAAPNIAAIKSRIKNGIEKELFVVSGSSGRATKKWLKEDFNVDFQPFLDRLKKFEIEAVNGQINNILSGQKGLEFGKYIDAKMKEMIKDYVKEAFGTGPFKNKLKLIKMRYALSGGKNGLDKEIISLYKKGQLDSGAMELIEDAVSYVADLGLEVSQAIRLEPDGGGELPEMAQYSEPVRKWQDDYNKVFPANDEAALTSYIKTATAAIWEL
jgi:hypothetical protein